MTRRWWLPYAAWALVVGTGLVFTQPGFAYCAGLHPRMCANALYANLPGSWDLSGAVATAVVLAIGWTIIAAWRVLGRNTGLAFAAWTVVVGIPMLFFGREIPTCLGPLGVTVDECRAAFGLPPETSWDRFANGPGPLVLLLLAGWLVIVMAGTLRRRQRGGL
jgi:hypothetical protein